MAKKLSLLIQQALDRVGHLVTARELSSLVRNGTIRFPGTMPHDKVFAQVVRVAIRNEGITIRSAHKTAYYGHVSRPTVGGMPLPTFHVVEAALIACVRASRSAVHIETLKRFVAANDRFKLPPTSRALSSVISTLVYMKRVEVIKKGRNRNYYTMRGETRRVRCAEINERDRLLAAFRRYWTLAGKRPFTTTAFRLHVKKVERHVQSISRQALGGFLQWAEKAGLVTAVRRRTTYRLLWAWPDDWKPLSALEKRARLCDVRHPASTSAARQGASAHDLARARRDGRLDIRFESAMDNVRSLVCATKVEKANAHQGDRRAVLEAQPVTRAEVAKVARLPKYRCLVRGKTPLETRLKNSVRPLDARRVARRIVCVGRVGHVAYFDVRGTSEAMSYVKWVSATRRAHALIEDREVTNFAYPTAGDEESVHRCPAALLASRAHAIAQTAQKISSELERLHERAPLTVAQRNACARLVERLNEANMRVQDKANHRDACDRAMPSVANAFDLASVPAWCLIAARAAVTEMQLAFGGSRARCWGLLNIMTANVRCDFRPDLRPEGVEQEATGRGALFLDRIDFAMYCTRKWGGPHTNLPLGLAHAVTGACRETVLLHSVLKDKDEAGHHESILYALGFFDDPDSRTAITNWLSMALSDNRRVHSLLPQLGAASMALAPKLFGGVTKKLPFEQASVLAAVAQRFENTYAGHVAKNVLRAWQEPAHRITMFLG